MFNSFDESVAVKNQPVWSGALKALAIFASIALVILLLSVAIILSLIPIYLRKQDLSVVASCSSCSVNVYDKFTVNGKASTEAVGYYSCQNFCTGKLGGGAVGAAISSKNYTSDATKALGSNSYSCNIAQSSSYNCINSYGSADATYGLFYITNNGNCNTPYGVYRCCCRSQSG